MDTVKRALYRCENVMPSSFTDSTVVADVSLLTQSSHVTSDDCASSAWCGRYGGDSDDAFLVMQA
jgi:hypothetical protein